MRLLLSLALAAAALAETATPDASTLIAKVVERRKAEWPAQRKYVHREEVTHGQTDKSGKKDPDRTETFDVLFLEGSLYRKLIFENGKTLPPAQQKKVDEALNKERLRRAGQRRSGLLSRSVSFGDISELPRLCDITIAEASVDGRPVWKFEAIPRPGLSGKTEQDKGTLSTKSTYWIDQREYAVVKEETMFLTARNGWQPGSTMTTSYEKIHDDCWLPVREFLNIRFKPILFVDVKVTTETRYVDYRKFDVETSVEFGEANQRD